ncbi:MAG TPA: preprotein translocase subunit SecG [Gemmataceae bacterium]|nr:preprotein translocase subunit SecG [Gemmataceae bacterium]
MGIATVWGWLPLMNGLVLMAQGDDAAPTGLRAWLPGVLNVILLLVGLFLILLVLIQKGKGGGLAGAFGGSGGSSAFGSRAGDTFTRITIYVAAVWFLLIMITIKVVQPTKPLQDAEQVRPVPGEQPPESGQ